MSKEPYKENFDKMMSNIGTSFKKAIKAMCFQCSGYDYSEVRSCKVTDCPLYVVLKNRENAPKRTLSPGAFGRNKDNDDDQEENSIEE